jgi:VanZ family protein
LSIGWKWHEWKGHDFQSCHRSTKRFRASAPDGLSFGRPVLKRDRQKREFPTRLSTDRHHVLKAWIAAILWLIVIAIESTSYLSAHTTSRILYPVLHFLFGLSHARFEHWHFYIRKGGHVFGYGLLSFLLFRAWRETLPAINNAKWTMRWATIAVIGTAVVASLDEWHQSYIPSRTGTPWDVLLDTSAGIVAQVLVLLWIRWV